MVTTNHQIATRIKAATGVDIDMCYQCGKCTAGCVLADDMDYPSSMIMRMLQTNDEENYHKIISSFGLRSRARCNTHTLCYH